MPNGNARLKGKHDPAEYHGLEEINVYIVNIQATMGSHGGWYEPPEPPEVISMDVQWGEDNFEPGLEPEGCAFEDTLPEELADLYDEEITDAALQGYMDWAADVNDWSYDD